MEAIIFNKEEKEKFTYKVDFWNRIEPVELENGKYFISKKCYEMLSREKIKELGEVNVEFLKEEDFKTDSIDQSPTKPKI